MHSMKVTTVTIFKLRKPTTFSSIAVLGLNLYKQRSKFPFYFTYFSSVANVILSFFSINIKGTKGGSKDAFKGQMLSISGSIS